MLPPLQSSEYCRVIPSKARKRTEPACSNLGRCDWLQFYHIVAQVERDDVEEVNDPRQRCRLMYPRRSRRLQMPTRLYSGCATTSSAVARYRELTVDRRSHSTPSVTSRIRTKRPRTTRLATPATATTATATVPTAAAVMTAAGAHCARPRRAHHSYRFTPWRHFASASSARPRS